MNFLFYTKEFSTNVNVVPLVQFDMDLFRISIFMLRAIADSKEYHDAKPFEILL